MTTIGTTVGTTAQSQTGEAAPVIASERIESLDVLRGFALLGILLLNIIGFGLHSAGYFNPLIGLGDAPTLNLVVWGGVDVLFEGAMRTLFSMLFGAGVVMFTTGFGTQSGAAKTGSLHYKRNFWLLVFGIFDAFILLWNGDILIVYALAGAMLYPLRNLSPKTLIVIAGVLLLAMSAFYGVSGYSLAASRDIAAEVARTPGAGHSAETLMQAEFWQGFAADFQPDASAIEAELAARSGSYLSAMAFNTGYMIELLFFAVPVYLLWDALAMMLLGMAFYRQGLLTGLRSHSFYLRLTLIGFSVGLVTNGYEVFRAAQSDFDLMVLFSYARPTYHVGRLGMALGYLGLVMLICQTAQLPALRRRLAAVGRTALSNYLLHSLICLIIFTGAGFSLVGELQRWQLYPIVFGIWTLQLLVSPWWLKRFAFGPAEWLWRTLTYGSRQRFLSPHQSDDRPDG